MLFEDMSDLCTSFSSTFRHSKYGETIESIKERNREFANWAQLLLETVNYYGTTGKEWNDQQAQWVNGDVRGPLYCGLNMPLVIPAFNMRIYGPISVTKFIVNNSY